MAYFSNAIKNNHDFPAIGGKEILRRLFIFYTFLTSQIKDLNPGKPEMGSR